MPPASPLGSYLTAVAKSGLRDRHEEESNLKLLFRHFPGRSLILRHPHTIIAVVYDLLAAAGLWACGLLIGHSALQAEVPALSILVSTLIVAAIEFGCFLQFGLYRGIWRYASLHDVKQIVQSVCLSALFVPAGLVLWNHASDVPRLLFVLNPLLLVLFMGGGRIMYRWWKEHRPYAPIREKGQPLLLLGAGEEALKLVEALGRSQSWYVVGLLDDDRRKVGRDLAGIPVLGRWDHLPAASEATGARHAILAVADADHRVRRRAFQQCEIAGIELLVVPGVEDVISGRVRISKLRHIEVDDLLGRDPVQLNEVGLKQWISRKTVLVTGAGGSIGSELSKQIACFNPRRIVLLDHSEFALYQIAEHFATELPLLDIRCVIADIRDAQRLDKVFSENPPDLVFHAAAYKHVPLMERDNAAQAITNNTLGTRNIGEACLRHDVERLVFVSTDKAVNPTNVMGASKRLAEMSLQHMHMRDKLPVVMVRFGNVLGSTGSVIPKFKGQIARGGPITVTHPDILRYFMSISEAAQLVLQAGLMGHGGEVFVLDMGDPVRIVDLARDMIRLSGLSEDEIRIEFTGLRPGEKLYEELLADDETTLPTPHPKLRVQRPMAPPGPTWERKVQTWLAGARDLNDAEIRAGLSRFVPEYQPAPGLSMGPVEDAFSVSDLSSPTKASQAVASGPQVRLEQRV